MNPNIKIRHMLASDLQHVGPLYREMLNTTRELPYPMVIDIDKEIEDFSFLAMRTLRAIAEEKLAHTWLALVAVDGGVTKGFLSGGLCTRIIGQPKGYFLGEVLYVTPKFRHRGLGNSLVKFAVEWAAAQGVGAFEVSFTPGTNSHKQWSRMGFRSYAGLAVYADKNFKPILDYPEFQAKKEAPKSESENGLIKEEKLDGIAN